jgi:hypothetical protein
MWLAERGSYDMPQDLGSERSGFHCRSISLSKPANDKPVNHKACLYSPR